LRAVKNRFGSTNEIGVFEMNEKGLQCVDNPSEMLLSGRPENSSGTCVTCVMEGSRPILSEVQALVSQSGHSSIRRSNGIDYNRMTMLLAVLEKRAGMPLSNCDAFVNVVGGLVIDETAADLAAILALASSYLDRTIGKDVAAIGEVGLSGEIRQVSSMTQRLSEIQRLGFQTCVIPETGKEFISQFPGLNLISAKNIYECIQKILKTKRD
jgi:DNA repair protein RadA/Sms